MGNVGLLVREPVGVGVHRRNRHQADELQSRCRVDSGAHGVDPFGRGHVDSAAGLVPVEADLHVHPHRRVAAFVLQRLGRPAVQRVDQFDRVDGVRGVGPLRDRPGLIALDAPDHVPAHLADRSTARHLGDLLRGFLVTGLTECGAAQAV